MIKRVLIVIMCLLTALAGQAQTDGFVLKGKIIGAGKGQWIYLTDRDLGVVYDSVEMKEGVFAFRGTVEQPEIRCLTIYKDASDRESWSSIITLPLFMENTVMTVEAPYEKMPMKLENVVSPEVKVNGGSVHEEYVLYMKEYAALKQAYSDLYSRYGSAYYYHKGTTEDVFRLVKEIDGVRERIFQCQADFIQQHPNSPVVRYVVDEMVVERYGRKAAEQVVNSLPAEIRVSEEGRNLEKKLLHKPLYVNDPLPEVKMVTLDGKMVPIKEVVKKGHYTLVEFWASWCGPCRSDIPHLKQTYEKYRSKGFDIISVSIDDTPQAWKKAVEEEKMPWMQLCDTGGRQFDKNGIRAFGVTGVPSGFLIDPSGKVIQLKSRGGWLDMKLFELLDK